MSTHVTGGRRTIVVMAVVAVVCLAAGLFLSQLIVSPGKAAADAAPPTAGPITVPVESRVISNELVIRGDVGYDDPVALRVETGDLGGPAVVTGQVPQVGAQIGPASVALEIVGRPVIVLPGDLPTYRSLRAGVSGPDVRQLKAALASLGIDAGDPATDTYDSATAAGVRALYQKVGYEPPAAGEELQDTATAAREGVRSAQDGLAAAQRELAAAAAGPVSSVIIGLDTAVAVARQTLADEQGRCAAPTEEAPCSQAALVQAQGALAQAEAERAEAGAAKDVGSQRAAVNSAQAQLTAARELQAEAQAATLTPLPASEVVFVPTLPRRVDVVSAIRGGTVTGEFMSVSGATIQITGSATRADAELLTVGATGSITLDDQELPVTVAAVKDSAETPTDPGTPEGEEPEQPAAPKGDRRAVVFTLGSLTPEQVVALQNTNVRVRVPVSSTQGEVLAVPLAALTAGPGGESRVELAGAGGKASSLVTVTTGLAADGYVEISSAESPLVAGDLVVVGVADTEKKTADAEADE
ncbi:peptidoglycan-binding protein [Cellulomonas sp. Root137]|uniref:peptidoglycan-binding protein n=1 Tax=Cellulomonas sp. Root137 TaxID=1736459 RepID=UPI000AFE11E6|nr:peptidoglycan-binding protein [Cellulomonas sp. Root137]